MRNLIIIEGRSATGKDALINEVSKKLNIPIAVPTTTRPPRENEVDGVTYNFKSLSEFALMLIDKEVAEYTIYSVTNGDTWYYGLTKAELEKSDNVLVITNPKGRSQLETMYGDKITTILIESDPAQRLFRSLTRDCCDKETRHTKVLEMCRRTLSDEEDFKKEICDYVVYNDDFKTACKHLEDIVKEIISDCEEC